VLFQPREPPVSSHRARSARREQAYPPAPGRPVAAWREGLRIRANPACRSSVPFTLQVPAGKLAQVQRVRLAGQAVVSRQEPGESDPFGIGEGGLDRGERSRLGRPWSSGTSRPGWNRKTGRARPRRLTETHRKPPGRSPDATSRRAFRRAEPPKERPQTAGSLLVTGRLPGSCWMHRSTFPGRATSHDADRRSMG
jgi:hypothetical protein